jgi:redox-sensitive bicupin YhaK (pirin superfamily)
VHHFDAYPKGNAEFGPVASLEGRTTGQDFSGRDGWNMYHGATVPGFPRHPHRGFETVTVVRQGLIDHADSLGAAARYGHGDVQWLTAGAGIQHAEMFPLLNQEGDNPAELFQIWLNLPKANKFAKPYFSMFWSETIPLVTIEDDCDRKTRLTLVAGSFGHHVPPRPPPESWAAHADSDVAIWTLALDPHAKITLPAAKEGSLRVLYVFEGESCDVMGQSVQRKHVAQVEGDGILELVNGTKPCEILLLQGRPIGEPVAKYGPFVMNTSEEIQQAVADYQATQFGGWPWPRKDPVHGSVPKRFAKHADGRMDEPA